MGYQLKVRKKVGCDDFKCVPHYCFTDNYKRTLVYLTMPLKHIRIGYMQLW